MYKIIASDLDGTLLNGEKKISDFTQQVLMNEQKSGKTVILASGRYKKEVLRYAEQLELSKNHGWIVCGNGYEVTNMATQQVKTFTSIQPNEAKKLCDIAKELGLSQYVKIHGNYHLTISDMKIKGLQRANQMVKWMQRHGLKRLRYTTHLLDETKFIETMEDVLDEPIVKIALIGTPKRLASFEKIIKNKYLDQYAIYYVNPLSLEITNKDVSKKNAVAYICEQIGCTLNDVIAFGDSGNDEPLLKSAGIGYTMKNGTKKALSQANLITEFSNEKDGVAKTLLKIAHHE